jgi:peptidoglycan/LPS O-acetylase OafA/YrhL
VIKRHHDLGYRPDIDGLRAVAILAVVAFHAAPGRMRGGFVGVDVFFVISGFLISGIILRKVREDSFRLIDFYARRVRRILPALAVVLAATMALGWFFLLPEEYVQLGRHVLAGSFFSSNLLLWSEAGYFDLRSDQKPLLHLWSLGIEEQFYLLWPLALMLLLKLRWKPTRAIAAIAGVSFVLNLALLPGHPTAVFYSPATRIWELLIGAWLAAVYLERTSPEQPLVPARFADVASVAGLALIGGAALGFSAETRFPGWQALAPTLGAALLIAAGPASRLNRHLLSNRVAVGIGLISYPLYLWHWPLISYANILVLDDINNLRALKLGAVVVAFGAAVLTYRWIEVPLYGKRLGLVAGRAAGGLAAVTVAGAALLILAGVPARYSLAQQEIITSLDEERRVAEEEYRRDTCFLSTEASFSDLARECLGEGRPRVALWGDSYAAHLYPGLKRLSPPPRLAQLTMGSCPPVFGYESPTVEWCQNFNERVQDALPALEPVTLVLAADWLSYFSNVVNFEPQLRTTFERLRSLEQEVLLVWPPVAWYGTQARIAIRTGSADLQPNASLYRLEGVDDSLRTLAQEFGFDYVSPVATLCRDGRCPVLFESGGRNRLFSWDWAHLTRDGSAYYAREILAARLGLAVPTEARALPDDH